MANKFTDFAPELDAPAINLETVDASASDDTLSQVARALYVGTAGNVDVTTSGGDRAVFVGVQAGSILPVRAAIVHTGTTTASDIIGLT